MRGFPLLQLVIVAVVFIAAGFPVWMLTRPAAADEAVALLPATVTTATPASAAPRPEQLTVSATFAPAPSQFQIQYADHTILGGQGPDRQFSARWQTVLPKEGLDLIIRAAWPTPVNADAPAGPAATRVIVQLPNGGQVEKSFWTSPDDALAEIVSVPGSPISTAAAAR